LSNRYLISLSLRGALRAIVHTSLARDPATTPRRRLESIGISGDFIGSVIERWRSTTISHRSDDDMADCGSPLDAPALQPAPT